MLNKVVKQSLFEGLDGGIPKSVLNKIIDVYS